MRDFPGGPVGKTSPSNAVGAGSSPVQGAKIANDLWPKEILQNIKQKQYWNKFNKDFKNGQHHKNLKELYLFLSLLSDIKSVPWEF